MRLRRPRPAGVQEYSAGPSVPLHGMHDPALGGHLEPHGHVVGFQLAGQVRQLPDTRVYVALLFACFKNKSRKRLPKVFAVSCISQGEEKTNRKPFANSARVLFETHPRKKISLFFEKLMNLVVPLHATADGYVWKKKLINRYAVKKNPIPNWVRWRVKHFKLYPYESW